MKQLILILCICTYFLNYTNAQVNLEVEGAAVIEENILIGGNATIEGNSTIGGNVDIDGDGTIAGAAQISGNTLMEGDVQIGTPLNNQNFKLHGYFLLKEDGVRQFVMPNWAPASGRVISGYFDGQGINFPVLRFYGPTYAYADIGVDAEGDIIFQTADVTKMTLLQDGKVGIGNLMPMELLDVNGGIRIGNSTSSNDGTIRFNGTDLQGHIGGAWTSLTGAGGSLWTPQGANIEYTTGNVGIGNTADPLYRLSVNDVTSLSVLGCNNTSGVRAVYNNVAFTIEPTIVGVNTSLLVRRVNGVTGAFENALIIGAVSGNVTAEYDLTVNGNLSKGGGSFKIDHPLDPENKYLYHSFVESPDMMNVYNGNTTTDMNGNAVVILPDYFEALNRDFRYQLTAIGTFAQVIIKEKLSDNTFIIASSEPNVEVSWQITGIRQDAYANKNRIPNEVEKATSEKGTYLHPEAFNQPLSKKLKVEHEMVEREDLLKMNRSNGIIIEEKY